MAIIKPKIIFWGTPEFATPALKGLIANNFKPILVVTAPDKPVGRKQEVLPPAIKILALENEIPVFQPASQKDLNEISAIYQPDVCVLVAFGMIIPDKHLLVPRLGFLNIHPSLLPAYRGPAPIQTAILNGDKTTGVSIIKLTAEVDAGPIVARKEAVIKPDDNTQTLSARLAQIGADLLLEILPDYLAGKILPKPQNEKLASYTAMIKREDGRLNWQKKAIDLNRQFRAFSPWPGVFTLIAGKRLKITNLGVLEGNLGANLAPGTLFLGSKSELAVKCQAGSVSLISVQPEGKKEMSGADFLRGQKSLLGKILE